MATLKKVPSWNPKTTPAYHDGLVRLGPDFSVERVLKTRWEILYPETIALTPNNTAYIGMRGVVAEIDLSSSVALERWLLPPNASRHEPSP